MPRDEESHGPEWPAEDSAVRLLPLAGLGERYRRYRLADPVVEEAMAGSLRRHGQQAPIVVVARADQWEVVDGFKRVVAARLLG